MVGWTVRLSLDQPRRIASLSRQNYGNNNDLRLIIDVLEPIDIHGKTKDMLKEFNETPLPFVDIV